jgi:hypothetical protein
MSATLDATPVARLLGDAPVLIGEGKAFPVEERFLEPERDRSLTDRVVRAVGLALRETAGDILVFLPGAGEIRRAAQALEQLFARAAAEGIELAGVSAYRSYPRQATIFRENWEQDPEEANRSSARPGESEHQTGLAIDVSSPSVNYVLTQAFGETEEGRWLAQNAADFGFILRYPQGKEDITGYLYEPWHIRYVGRPAAEAIAQSGLTLEEFLAEGSAVL